MGWFDSPFKKRKSRPKPKPAPSMLDRIVPSKGRTVPAYKPVPRTNITAPSAPRTQRAVARKYKIAQSKEKRGAAGIKGVGGSKKSKRLYKLKVQAEKRAQKARRVQHQRQVLKLLLKDAKNPPKQSGLNAVEGVGGKKGKPKPLTEKERKTFTRTSVAIRTLMDQDKPLASRDKAAKYLQKQGVPANKLEYGLAKMGPQRMKVGVEKDNWGKAAQTFEDIVKNTPGIANAIWRLEESGAPSEVRRAIISTAKMANQGSDIQRDMRQASSFPDPGKEAAKIVKRGAFAAGQGLMEGFDRTSGFGMTAVMEGLAAAGHKGAQKQVKRAPGAFDVIASGRGKGKERISGGKLAKELGLPKEAGLAFEIGLDPTTYVGIAAAPYTGGASLSLVLAKAGNLGMDVSKYRAAMSAAQKIKNPVARNKKFTAIRDEVLKDASTKSMQRFMRAQKFNVKTKKGEGRKRVLTDTALRDIQNANALSALARGNRPGFKLALGNPLQPTRGQHIGATIPLPRKMVVPTHRGLQSLGALADTRNNRRYIRQTEGLSANQARALHRQGQEAIRDALTWLSKKPKVRDQELNRIGTYLMVREGGGVPAAERVNKVLQLSDDELQFAEQFRGIMDEFLKGGQEVGFLKGVQKDYFPRYWNIMESLTNEGVAPMRTGTSTTFRHERTLPNVVNSADQKVLADLLKDVSKVSLKDDDAMRLAEELHHTTRQRVAGETLARQVMRGEKVYRDELTKTELAMLRYDERSSTPVFRQIESPGSEGRVLIDFRGGEAAQRQFDPNIFVRADSDEQKLQAAVNDYQRVSDLIRQTDATDDYLDDLQDIADRLEREVARLRFGKEVDLDELNAEQWRELAETLTPYRETYHFGDPLHEIRFNESRAAQSAASEKWPRNVEWVPVSALKGMEGNVTTPGKLDALRADIKENGIREPIIIEWGKKDGYAYIGEGNNRLAIAKELGIEEVPVRVHRRTEAGKGRKITDPVEVYVPEDLRASDLGLPGRLVVADGNTFPASKGFHLAHRPQGSAERAEQTLGDNFNYEKGRFSAVQLDEYGQPQLHGQTTTKFYLDQSKMMYRPHPHGSQEGSPPGKRPFVELDSAYAPDMISTMKGVPEEDEYNALLHQLFPYKGALKQRFPNNPEEVERRMEVAARRLQALRTEGGFEGIAYQNAVEDVGWPSYHLFSSKSALDKNQVKQLIIANYGEQAAKFLKIQQNDEGIVYVGGKIVKQSELPPAQPRVPTEPGPADDTWDFYGTFAETRQNPLDITEMNAARAGALYARGQGFTAPTYLKFTQLDRMWGRSTADLQPVSGNVYRDPTTGEEFMHVGNPEWSARIVGEDVSRWGVGLDRAWPVQLVDELNFHRNSTFLGHGSSMRQAYDTALDTGVQKVLGSVRWGVTVPFPAYHIRNMISDMIKSVQADTGVIFHPIVNAKLSLGAFGLGKGNKIKVPHLGEMNMEDYLLWADYFGVRSNQHMSEFSRLIQDGAVSGAGRTGRALSGLTRLSGSREDIVRHMTFIQALRRNKGDAAEAMWYTVKHHFDYNDLSAFERQKIRNLFLFYTWYRKNIPLQLVELVRRPGFFAGVASTYRSLEAGETPINAIPGMEGAPPEIAALPEYVKDKLMAPTMSWNDHAMTIGFGAPYADLQWLSVDNGLAQMLTLGNPLITTGYQLKSRDDLLTGREYKDLESSPIADVLQALGVPLETDGEGRATLPWRLSVILRQIPIFGRASTSFGEASQRYDQGRLSKWSQRLSWLTGLNIKVWPEPGSEREEMAVENTVACYGIEYARRLKNISNLEGKDARPEAEGFRKHKGAYLHALKDVYSDILETAERENVDRKYFRTIPALPNLYLSKEERGIDGRKKKKRMTLGSGSTGGIKLGGGSSGGINLGGG